MTTRPSFARRRGPRVAAAAALVVAVAGCSAERGGADRLATARADERAAHPLLVRDGDAVMGGGFVIATSTGPRLCGQGRSADPRWPDPEPLRCDPSVPLPGFDVKQLPLFEGTRAGNASFSGTWREGGVQVASQSAASPDYPVDHTTMAMDSAVVPCPEPAGGWPPATSFPREDYPAALLAHRDSHPQDVVSVAVLQPLESQSVLGVVAADASAADRLRRAVTADYGDAVCVVVADPSPQEMEPHGPAAADALAALGVLHISDPSFVTGLRLRISWSALVMDERLQDRWHEAPEGLVHVTPLVGPQRSS